MNETMKTAYIATRLQPEYTSIIGVYSTFDKAKAAIHRYMNQYGFSLEKYQWNQEMWRYENKNALAEPSNLFHIGRWDIDKI